MPRKTLYIQPNKGAIAAAKRGLEARKKAPKSKKGGLDTQQAKEEGVGSGVARARDIIAGKKVNAYQVKAFFDRHRQNYINAKLKGLKPEESRAIQAWLIWGGEPLRKQAERAVAKHEKELAKKKARRNPRKPKVHATFSKWTDAQKMAKKHPATFEAPDIDELKDSLKLGDFVKFNIGSERIWLIVIGFDEDKDEIAGLLDNKPMDEKYQVGDVVRIKLKHVYDYDSGNKTSVKKAEDFLDSMIKEESEKGKKKAKKKASRRKKNPPIPTQRGRVGRPASTADFRHEISGEGPPGSGAEIHWYLYQRDTNYRIALIPLEMAIEIYPRLTWTGATPPLWVVEVYLIFAGKGAGAKVMRRGELLIDVFPAKTTREAFSQAKKSIKKHQKRPMEIEDMSHVPRISIPEQGPSGRPAQQPRNPGKKKKKKESGLTPIPEDVEITRVPPGKAKGSKLPAEGHLGYSTFRADAPSPSRWRGAGRGAGPEPHRGNPRKKKAKKKAPSAKELTAKCQKLWEHYCKRPGITRLRAVYKHCEEMKASKAKSVAKERQACMRCARAEAKDRRWTL